MNYRGVEPLRVASSSNAVSTADAGRWTYLTTDPRMKTFFTATCTRQRYMVDGVYEVRIFVLL